MATDGRNITVDAYGDATKLGLTARGAGVAESKTSGGMLTLSSRGFFLLELSNTRGDQDRTLGDLKAVPRSYSIENLDLTKEQGRIDALSVIDLALGDLDQMSKSLRERS